MNSHAVREAFAVDEVPQLGRSKIGRDGVGAGGQDGSHHHRLQPGGDTSAAKDLVADPDELSVPDPPLDLFCTQLEAL